MEDESLTTVRQRWTEGRQSRTRRRADEGFEERAALMIGGTEALYPMLLGLPPLTKLISDGPTAELGCQPSPWWE